MRQEQSENKDFRPSDPFDLSSNGFVQIELESDAYADAGWTLYEVQGVDTRYAVNTGSANIIQPGDQGSMTDPGVRFSAGSYTYRVQGFTNVNGAPGVPTYWSTPQTASLPEGTATTVTTSAITTNSFTLNWTGYAAANSSTNYCLYVVESQPFQTSVSPSYYQPLGIGSVSGTTSSSVTQAMSYTYPDCSPGMIYHCIVVTSANGSPAAFTRLNLTALGAVTPNTPINLPGTPGGIENNLAAVYVGGSGPGNTGGSVLLHWYDSANSESGFQIQRSLDGVNFTTIGTTGTDVDEYTDGSVGPDSVYWYRVCATGDSSGNYNSQYTITKQVNTPGVSIVVGSDNSDPLGDPIIPFDGVVPVTFNAPLGADTNGIVTASWDPAIELFADSQLTTQIGATSDSTSWDVSGGTTKTFYVEGVGGSARYGDQSFGLSANLTLLSTAALAADPAATQATANPTTAKPVTDEGPELLCNGKNVNGILAGDMMIGQSVNLSVDWVGPEPVAGHSADYNWDLPSSTLGGYFASLTVGETELVWPLIWPSVHFYWGPLGQNGGSVGETVSCDGETDGNAFSVETHFNVWTPESDYSDMPTANTPAVGWGDSGFTAFPRNSFHFGTKASPGATFRYSVTAPSSVGGTAFLTQLVNDHLSVHEAGNTYSLSTQGSYVLDDGGTSSFVYAGKTLHIPAGIGIGTTSSDTPTNNPYNLEINAISEFRTFDAVTYLMWQPDGQDTIPVALQQLTWGFSFNDTDPFGDPATQSHQSTVSKPSTQLPTWDDYWTDRTLRTSHNY